MSAPWYYTPDGKSKFGPFNFDQLQELARTGKLKPTDMVRQDGTARWMVGKEIANLFPANPAPAPANVSPPAAPAAPAAASPKTAEPESSPIRWFSTADGKSRQGPFTLAELKDRAKQKQLEPGHMLCPEGGKSWKPAHEMADLFESSKPTAGSGQAAPAPGKAAAATPPALIPPVSTATPPATPAAKPVPTPSSPAASAAAPSPVKPAAPPVAPAAPPAVAKPQGPTPATPVPRQATPVAATPPPVAKPAAASTSAAPAPTPKVASPSTPAAASPIPAPVKPATPPSPPVSPPATAPPAKPAAMNPPPTPASPASPAPAKPSVPSPPPAAAGPAAKPAAPSSAPAAPPSMPVAAALPVKPAMPAPSIPAAVAAPANSPTPTAPEAPVFDLDFSPALDDPSPPKAAAAPAPAVSGYDELAELRKERAATSSKSTAFSARMQKHAQFLKSEVARMWAGPQRKWVIVGAAGAAAMIMLICGLGGYWMFSGSGGGGGGDQTAKNPKKDAAPPAPTINKLSDPKWTKKDYSSANYSIEFPGEPDFFEMRGLSNLSKATVHIVKFEDSDLKLISFVLPLPSFENYSLSQFYRLYRPVLPELDGDNRPGTIVDAAKVVTNGKVGREYCIKSHILTKKQPKTLCRVFRTDKRLHVVSASGNQSDLAGDVVKHFFDSLQIQGEQPADLLHENVLAKPVWKRHKFGGAVDVEMPGDPGPASIPLPPQLIGQNKGLPVASVQMVTFDDSDLLLAFYVLPYAKTDRITSLERFYSNYVPLVPNEILLGDMAQSEKVIQDGKEGWKLVYKRSPNEIAGTDTSLRMFAMEKGIYVFLADSEKLPDLQPVIDRFFGSIKIEGKQPGPDLSKPVQLASLWKKYTDNVDSYEIDMPGVPKTDRKRNKETRDAQRLAVVEVDGSDLHFEVFSMRLPQQDPRKDDEFFADAKEDFLDSFPKSKLLKEERITIDGKPGLQLKVQGESMTYVWRVVRVPESRYHYEVEVSSSRLQDYEPDIDRFFKSFRFLKSDKK